MIHINASTCKPCGLCGKVCPRHLTEVVEEKGKKRTVVAAERSDLCMNCGHCAAVCPTGSITVDGLDAGAFDELAPIEISDGQLLTLMRQRRSVRRYKNRPVPRDVLDRIVEAVHASPTGAGSVSNGVIIVDRRGAIETMMAHTYAMYEKLDRMLSSAIPRYFVKRKAGARSVGMLDRFVMPAMRWYIRWRKEGRGDEISRDCPALMLFYGAADEPMVEANCTLAAFHAILMAEALGVGTCFNHLISGACNRSPELRAMLSLAEDAEVHAGVTMGYPAIKFLRAIPRRAAEVRYL
jgi:nitroreductase/NAD-dependent dihydropyrimidine dehydrogenase PreA subunit